MEPIVLENLHIYTVNENGDGLTIVNDGQNTNYKILNSSIQLYRTHQNDLDENLSFVDGVHATVENCLIAGGTKLILCGNGDHPNTDKNMKIVFRNCVFKDFGRRGPEAQDGATVVLENCVIWNWGVENRFSVRNFAAWAHANSKIIMHDCVLIQDKFWQCSLKNMIIDIANHIGNDFNDKCLSLKSLIPGVMRGLFETNNAHGGIGFCDSCKNWWVWVECADMFDTGNPHHAREIIRETFTKCGLNHLTVEAIKAYEGRFPKLKRFLYYVLKS